MFAGENWWWLVLASSGEVGKKLVASRYVIEWLKYQEIQVLLEERVNQW